jgi:hypothetical protein
LTNYIPKLSRNDYFNSIISTRYQRTKLTNYKNYLTTINNIPLTIEGKLFLLYYTHFNGEYNKNILDNLDINKFIYENNAMYLIKNRVIFDEFFMYIAQAIKEMYNSINISIIDDDILAWTMFIQYVKNIKIEKEYNKKFYKFGEIDSLTILRKMRNYNTHNNLPSFLSYYVEALKYLKDVILNILNYAYLEKKLSYYYYILKDLFTAHKILEKLIIDIYNNSIYYTDIILTKNLREKILDIRSFDVENVINF